MDHVHTMVTSPKIAKVALPHHASLVYEYDGEFDDGK
jgi:hypothetical protein